MIQKPRGAGTSTLSVLLFVIVTAIGLPEPADAQTRGRTTKSTASVVKPSPSRSTYMRAVTNRKAGANRTARTTRSSAGRSALGDTRRQGVRLTGSPATSWRAWDRASRTQASRSGNARPDGRRQRSSSGGMNVRFRSRKPRS